MLSETARWRMLLGVTIALAGSFIAGCCGGPFSASGDGGCMNCSEATASADPGCDQMDAGLGGAALD
jgi:hypothetical protein